MDFTDDTVIIRCHMKDLNPYCRLNVECKAATKFGGDQLQSECKFPVETYFFPIHDRFTRDVSDSSILKLIFTAPEDDVVIVIWRSIKSLKSLQFITVTLTLLDLRGNEKILSYLLFLSEVIYTCRPFLNKEYELINYLKDKHFTLLCKISASSGWSSDEIICSYKILNYGHKIWKTMVKFLNKSKTSFDVQLRSNNTMFPARKSVLLAHSPVFACLFEQKATKTDVVDIVDIDLGTLNSCLNFMHTGVSKVKDYKSAINLLWVADKYQITALKEECLSFLMYALSKDNALEILVATDKVRHNRLKLHVIFYIKNYARSILRSSEWLQLIKTNSKLVSEVLSEMSS